MKFIASILMMLLSFASIASETKTFFYDGSQDSVEMVLRSEKFHTEYEQRPSTCYRQDVFYRQICHRTPQGTFCNTVPHYRTVPYRCMQTVSRQVKDYDVEATVELNVVDSASLLTKGESFSVSLNGDTPSIVASGSKNFFVLLKKTEVQSQMAGRLKLMNVSYTAELVEAAPIVRALNLTNIVLKENILNFTMGPVAVPEAIGFRLNVSKAPLLGRDTVLFNRELSSSELVLKSFEATSSVDVDIQRLGINMGSGRHLLTATAFFKHEGKLLNAQQFERTEAGRTLILKR